MSSYLRYIGGGAVIGALAAGLLAVPSLLPPVLADDAPAKTLLSAAGETWPPGFDTDNLVKYDYTIEPGVSTDVVKTRTVRKIGYGRTELVDIYTTPTGTYSSDGLSSPQIRYPGIRKDLKRAPWGRIALWADGWTVFREIDAGSFVSVIPFEGGQLVTSEDGNCVFVGKAAYC